MGIRVRTLGVLGAAGVLLLTAAAYGPGQPPPPFAQAGTMQSAEYPCTGYPEPFSVPPGVTSLTIAAEGAAGGGDSAGRGGTIKGTLAVTPNQLLTITVGCRDGYGQVRGGDGGSSANEG